MKGCRWLEEDRITLDRNGILGDRAWSPVDDSLDCLKANDAPQLCSLRISPSELPTPEGEEVSVTYWGRRFDATIHDGPVADAVSRTVGRRLRLAHTQRRPGFVWSSTVSVVLLSELTGLPMDVARYRANIVLDDRDAPLRPAIGDTLELDGVTLRCERRLDRCVVINHDPDTGRRGANLLPKLGAGLLLGYGCSVLEAGTLKVERP